MVENHPQAWQAHIERLTPAASSYTSRFNAFQKDSSKNKDKQQVKAKDATTTTSFEVSESERDIARSTAVGATEAYYNIVTRSYEAGWSSNFHYCPFAPGMSITSALDFYVHRLALLMGLRPGMRVLDVGCGVGGPAREVARLVGCEVVGVTINQYQVDRATELTLREGMGRWCTFIRADFMKLDEVFPEDCFDAALACEATCHAPDLANVYAQVARVVKPGGVFGFTEELLWDKENGGRWEEANERHRGIRNKIEVGGGMASLQSVSVARDSLRKAGFEIEFDEDFTRYFEGLSGRVPVVVDAGRLDEGEVDVERNRQCLWEGGKVKSFSPVKLPTQDGQSWYYAPPPSSNYPAIESTKEQPIPPMFRPWYYPILGTKEAIKLAVTAEDRKTVSTMSHWNRRIAFALRKLYVWLGWSPPGLVQLNKMMELYLDAGIEGAKEEIFTPCWMFIARKVEGARESELLEH